MKYHLNPNPNEVTSVSAKRIALLPAFALLIALLTTSMACGSGDWLWERQLSRTAPPPPREPQDDVYRGSLILGESVRSFTPCGESRAIWVVDETGGLLTKIFNELASGKDQAVYVEMRGVFGPAPEGKAAIGYDGQLRVQVLVRAALIGEGGGCDSLPAGVDYRAYGNEPFWTVDIGPRGIVFRHPDIEKPIIFPPTLPDLQNGILVFDPRSIDVEKHRIRVMLQPKPCRDNMSGAYLSWTATVVLDDKTYRGYAMQGWRS